MNKSLAILFVVLCIASSHAQNLISDLTRQLNDDQKKYVQLKPFFVFNQNKYSPGDTIYYKVYFLTNELRPVGGPAVLRLSLFNKEGNEVVKQNISIKDGTGFNQMIVPDSIATGFYQFVAYNGWMRNFDPSLFFKKEILIVKQKEIKKVNADSTPLISFYPEGGKLVDGVSNRVILKTQGLKEGSTGTIMEKNGSGDGIPVTNFTVQEKGLTPVIFIPNAEKEYVAELNGHRFNFPSVEKNGISILAQPTATSNPIRILIATAENSSLLRKELTLVVLMNRKIYYSATVSLSARGFGQVMLPQEDLPPGVAQIVIFDNRKKIAERFLLVNSNQVKVTFSDEITTVNPCQQIPLNFKITDQQGKPLPGEYSLAAVNQKLFSKEPHNSFADELYFPLNSNFIIDHDDPDWYAKIDQWLITQKSLSFEGIKTPLINEFEFESSLGIKGSAYFTDSKQSLPDSSLIIFYLQKHLTSYQAYVKDGKFDLDFLFDFWGLEEIFYLVEQNGSQLKNVKIEIESSQISTKPLSNFIETGNEDLYANFHFKQRLIDKSYSFYNNDTAIKSESLNPNEEFEDKIMGADISVNVQDYIVFPTMEELIKEIIPALSKRKNGGVRVILSEPAIPTTGDPLYLIDGILTTNTEFFMAMLPSEILTLKIVNNIEKLNRFGLMGKNGIVLIQTKRPDMKKLKESANLLLVNGFTLPVHFKNQNHSKTSPTRIPDFRSTLYWNPIMKTDANGNAAIKFYASDDVGPIEITINGMTFDGRPFSTRKTVNVSADSANQKK
jgi:hypothetical protein